MAINANPDLGYSIVRWKGADRSHYYIVGTDRIEALESLPSSVSVSQEGAEAESFGPLEELVVRSTSVLHLSNYPKCKCLLEVIGCKYQINGTGTSCRLFVPYIHEGMMVQ